MAWCEDFFEVDLNRVPLPELDPDWATSKGYTREQMAAWIRDLEEIQRRLRREGWRPEDFERLRHSSEPAEGALGQTYHKFYDHGSVGQRLNHDFIRVEWAGDHYEIVNGRHRIWLAKQRGLRTVPAQVSAPDWVTLERLRLEGERAARCADQGRASGRAPLWERSQRSDPQREVNRDRER